MIRRYRVLIASGALVLALGAALVPILSNAPVAKAWTTCGQVTQFSPTYYWHDILSNYTMYVAFQKQYDPTQTCAVRMHVWITTSGDLSGYNYNGTSYDTRIQGAMSYGTAYSQTKRVYASTVSVPHYSSTTNSYSGWVAGPCMHGFISLTDTTGRILTGGNPIYGPADPPYSAYSPAPASEPLCV